MAKHSKRRKPTRKIPRIDMQAGALDYFRSLNKRTNLLARHTAAVIKAVEKELESTGGYPADVALDKEDTIDADVQAARYRKSIRDYSPEQRKQIQAITRNVLKEKAQYENVATLKSAHKTAERSYLTTSSLNDAQMEKQLDAVGISTMKDGKTISRRKFYIRDNVKLIQSIGSQHFVRLESTILDSFNKGERSTEIAKKLAGVDGITKRRAKMIARDQTGSLNGWLVKDSHTANGISSFTWIDMDDEGVRPEHAELGGQVFDYRKGAGKGEAGGTGEGYPGTPIACRCYAEPSL